MSDVLFSFYCWLGIGYLLVLEFSLYSLNDNFFKDYVKIYVSWVIYIVQLYF